MKEIDKRELDWWRRVFSTRFTQFGLPRPGSALYGRRFKIMERVDGSDGEWVDVDFRPWGSDPDG